MYESAAIAGNGPPRYPTYTAGRTPARTGTGLSFHMVMEQDGDRINGSMPVWSAAQPETNEKTATVAQAPHHFGFSDLIDMVNPLQHIPLVGDLYRYLTGDTIKPIAQVIGDTLFGGPLGAVSALANVAVKDATGQDIADNLVAMLSPKDTPPIPFTSQSATGAPIRLAMAGKATISPPALSLPPLSPSDAATITPAAGQAAVIPHGAGQAAVIPHVAGQAAGPVFGPPVAHILASRTPLIEMDRRITPEKAAAAIAAYGNIAADTDRADRAVRVADNNPDFSAFGFY